MTFFLKPAALALIALGSLSTAGAFSLAAQEPAPAPPPRDQRRVDPRDDRRADPGDDARTDMRGDARADDRRDDRTPTARVWMDGDRVLRRGERTRAFFRADQDAYVMIVRIDTDGRLHILYPDNPRDEGWVRGGVTYSTADGGGDAFYADNVPGMGYVFAIASWDRFDMDALSRDGQVYDYHQAGYERIHGDPFRAMDDFARQVVYDRRAPYSLDYAEYYVDRHVDYPRFLCYDCHAYRTFAAWNPYSVFCSRYRVVVYDDFYYSYPRRYFGGVYSGSRVVYAGGRNVYGGSARYEFKQVQGGVPVTASNFIERRRRSEGTDVRRGGASNGGGDYRRGGNEQAQRIPVGPRDRDGAPVRRQPDDVRGREHELQVAPRPGGEIDRGTSRRSPDPQHDGRFYGDPTLAVPRYERRSTSEPPHAVQSSPRGVQAPRAEPRAPAPTRSEPITLRAEPSGSRGGSAPRSAPPHSGGGRHR